MSNDVNRDNGNGQYHKSGIVDFFEISIAILISVFSGFILGLLFAPQSGLKTRSKVAEKVRDAAGRLKFTMAEARVMGEDFLDKSIKKVSEVSSKVKGGDQGDNG
ncbi:MAG: YtxH domain-containing protein [Actinomycetota bacterium]|nr:YtxH domain-containing protein [Actinomycetota bacterium]